MAVFSEQSAARCSALCRSGLFQNGLVGFAAVLVGLLCGAAVAFGPFWAGFAVLAVLACGYGLLRSTNVGIAAILLVVTVMPFGTLPFKAVVTPNFLELALLALMGVWLLRLLVTPEATLLLTPLGLPIIGFLGLTLFAFVLGSNGRPDSLLLHNYFKFVLAVLFFFSIVNCVRDYDQAQFMLRCLIIGGAISAVVGLVIFALPNPLSERLLMSLGRVGYPTEGRVLRFVMDDTAGVERAIGLSVDPNSYGGMLALIGALAATACVAERPLLPRWLLVGAALALALVTFLTQSRGALGGLVVGVGFAAVVRYRTLLWPLLGVVVVGLVLYVGFGVGDAFVARVVDGVQFRDQANQMRLDEYRNALAVIQAYPIFGIGFGAAPQLDLVAGVSSIYLAIAQRIGLPGLCAFILIIGYWLWRVWRTMRVANARGDSDIGAWQLGIQAAIIAALAVGLLDHYFFNLEFAHMATLFWGVIGLGMALEQIVDAGKAKSEKPKAESSIR